MFSSNRPAEGNPSVSSLRRPRGPQALTLLCAFLHPTLFGLGAFLQEQPIKTAYRKHPYKPPGSSATAPLIPPPQQAENIFIDALARAALCQKHARLHSNPHLSSHTGSTYHKTRRRNLIATAGQTRCIHHAARVQPAITRTSPSREEYLSLVDTYRELYSTKAQWMEPTLPGPLPFPILFSPKPKNLMPLPPIMQPPSLMDDPGLLPLTPLTISDHKDQWKAPMIPVSDDETLYKSIEVTQAPKEEQQRQDVRDLMRVLENQNCLHEEAFRAYSALPSPGVSHLSEPQIRLLFRRLSATEKKDRDSALRYLSVVDEMKSLDLPMVEAEWNSAIAFCGQCFSYVRAGEVETALLTWKEMENEAGIKSSTVTFNILFDMAAKAGKFVLAEMILKEMVIRGLPFNRYSRVGNIYFNGLKGDGDGIRRAYKELVEAGEIVDTVVMNCVIAALITAGELASAENVYGRMKCMLSQHTGCQLPTRTWQETRDQGRIFNRLAHENRVSKRDCARMALLKEQVSIVPNIHTYAIFIEHHAEQTGNLHRISALLSEMGALNISIQGRIFLKLFKGFNKHGGTAYTAWTPQRLESVWDSFLEVLDEGAGNGNVRIGKWLVVWAVRAFDQCAGREWALHIWEEMMARWTPSKKELESVHLRLRDVLKVDVKTSWKEPERRKRI